MISVTTCCFIPVPCSRKGIRTALSLPFIVNQRLKKGYLVAFVPFENGKPSGNWELFADNFAGIDLSKLRGDLQYRPVGLAQGDDGSLYVADDLKGAIFKIVYNGDGNKEFFKLYSCYFRKRVEYVFSLL